MEIKGISEGITGAKAPDKQETTFREYQGLIGVFLKFLGAAGCLFFISYLAGVFAQFRIFLFPNQHNAIFMAVVLTLTFFLVPARKGDLRFRWYDILLILFSLAGCIYIIVNAFDIIYYGRLRATPLEMALAVIMVLALIEAVRRSFGWAMVIVVLIFIMYTKFGYLVPGALHVYRTTWSHLLSDMYLRTGEGIFGSLTSLSSGIIIGFITFGIFFIACGGGDFFLKLALGLTGRMRGGPAKAAILGSAMFGTISGSGSANIAVTGSITIPIMKSIGYKPHYAGAVETIASTGGMLMPPIMAEIAFIMAVLVGKSYVYIATIAALPALLYFISLYTQVHFQAVKIGLRGMPREQVPPLKATIKGGWEFVVPFVVLLILLYVLRWPAEIAAVYTIVSVVAISMFRKKNRMNFKKFIDSLYGGVRTTLPVANIIALAGIIYAMVSVSGVGPKLSAALVTYFGGNLPLLAIVSGIVCYIVGMGVSFVPAYIIISVLVGPAMVGVGVPLIVAHFFIMYMVLSGMFTPPYCPGAYVASAFAGAHPFRIGFQAMRLGVVTFLVPFIIVFAPALVLIGTPGEIALAAITAIIGIVGVSAGLEGFLFSSANWLQRLLLIIGGLAMFIPGHLTDLLGSGLLAVVAIWQWRVSRVIRSGVTHS